MEKVYYSIKKVNNDINLDEKQFSPGVIDHIRRYKNERAFMQSLTAWKLLDFMVQKIYGRALKESNVEFSKRGKPICDDFYFSISHAGDFVAVALSNGPCGIDIEKITERNNIDKIAVNIFGNKVNSEEDFYQSWTSTEAAAKMLDIAVCEVKNLKKNSLKKEFIKQGDYVICITCVENFVSINVNN